VPLLRPSVRNVCKEVSKIAHIDDFITNLTASPSGHFIYECKYERPYISRPSRTQQLENPKLLAKLKADAKPTVEVPEEFKNKYVLPMFCNCFDFMLTYYRRGLADKILEGKEKERLKEASSDSESSESDSEDDRRRERYVK
jgi:hypothetical protein